MDGLQDAIGSDTGLPAGSESSTPLGTLERGLHLLSLFTSDKPVWSLRELREASGLAKATVRRLILTLERLGWVAQDPDSGTFSLGPRILQGVYATTSASMLAALARTHLEQLAHATTESALLSVWGHEGPLTLNLAVTPRHFKPYTSVGTELPGLATADAQVLVAFSPESVWDTRFSALVGRTEGLAERDREAMRQRWREARRTGVAYDRGEWKPGVYAVAAPVLDNDGLALASVSVVMPSERATDDHVGQCATAARATAAAISRAHRDAADSADMATTG